MEMVFQTDLKTDSDDDGCSDANEAYADGDADGGDGGIYNPWEYCSRAFKCWRWNRKMQMELFVAAAYGTGDTTGNRRGRTIWFLIVVSQIQIWTVTQTLPIQNTGTPTATNDTTNKCPRYR